ncbi:MAG: flagellar basal-body MS-ring/collar protein FliF [Acidobacteriota bacterium]
MPEPNPFFNQLKLLNSRLTMSQKISIFAFAVAAAVGIGVLVYFMNQEDYQTLYSNLNAEESATVISRLKDSKVPYQLADSGKTVRVPSDKIDELRIQLASEGLPQSGKIGFEIFDKNSLGMTEFLEKVSYKRALEGELARTILSIKEIAQARVHLVLPKESLFEEKSEPTKASVVLKLSSGKQLSESVVSGIVHLVASAVEGLKPDHVTVVDASGRLLSAKPLSADEALTSNQLELKAKTEKALMAKIINILHPIVGEGRVRADATVTLDFSRSEQTEEKYDPQTTAIRSQQKSEERVEPGSVGNQAGVPGTKSNQATPAPNFVPVTGRSAATSTRQNETTNYEVSKLVRHTVQAYGEVKKLSVAVIVDDALKIEKSADGTLNRTTVARTPDELKKIRDLVVAAVGFDPNRGDQLTVENVAFGTAVDFEEVKPSFLEKWQDYLKPAIRYLAFFVLFLMVYFLLVRPVSKRVLGPIDQLLTLQEEERKRNQLDSGTGSGEPLSLEPPKTVKELEAALGLAPGGNAESTLAVPEIDVRKTDILKQRIVDFISKEPENSAQLIRVWLSEEGKG